MYSLLKNYVGVMLVPRKWSSYFTNRETAADITIGIIKQAFHRVHCMLREILKLEANHFQSKKFGLKFQ